MSAYIVSDEHIHAMLSFALRHADGGKLSWIGPGNDVPGMHEAGKPWGPAAVAVYQERSCVLDSESVDRFGQILVDQNYASVNHRYNKSIDPRIYHHPDPSGFSGFAIRYLTPVEMLKTLRGYEYQSCETPDWEETNAYLLCSALRELAIRKLPGYDTADTWRIV